MKTKPKKASPRKWTWAKGTAIGASITAILGFFVTVFEVAQGKQSDIVVSGEPSPPAPLEPEPPKGGGHVPVQPPNGPRPAHTPPRAAADIGQRAGDDLKAMAEKLRLAMNYEGALSPGHSSQVVVAYQAAYDAAPAWVKTMAAFNGARHARSDYAAGRFEQAAARWKQMFDDAGVLDGIIDGGWR